MIEAGIDHPLMVAADLLDEIRREELNRPRSVQRTIGPSGLGVECTRWLLHMLAETPEPAAPVGWYAWVGTAMHGRLEGILLGSEIQALGPQPRWLVEQRVTVGQIGHRVIEGNVDAFDVPAKTVVDWKSTGASSTKKLQAAIRKTGGLAVESVVDGLFIRGFVGGWPSVKYRVQLQCYGLGMLLAGHDVERVMDIFMPRNAAGMNDIWFWAEPFDAQVAMAALDRASGLAELIDMVGLDEALAMFADEPCTESHCPWCPKGIAAQPIKPPTGGFAHPA